MSDPPSRANIHRRVRDQHSTELAQDYLEAIRDLKRELGEVRVSELQEVFGVSHVTVIRTLKRLEDQGLLTSSRSKEINLTRKGTAIAKAAAERHELLRKFFVALGVSEEQADADAEGAEHHLSEETLDAIRKYLG